MPVAHATGTQSELKNDRISASLSIPCHLVQSSCLPVEPETAASSNSRIRPLPKGIAWMLSPGATSSTSTLLIYIQSDTSHRHHVTVTCFLGVNFQIQSSTSIHLLFDLFLRFTDPACLTVLGIALHKHCRMTPLGRCMNWRAHLWVFGVVVIWHCPSCRDVATVWNSAFFRTNHHENPSKRKSQILKPT